MKFKKLIAAVSAVAMVASLMVVPSNAEGQTSTDIPSTYDMQFKTNDTDYSATTNTIEINTGAGMFGAMRFTIPALPEGKVLKSASLKLITERVKTAEKLMGIYPLSTDVWTQEKISYATIKSDYESAIAKSPIVTFVPAGQNKKAIFDSSLHEDKLTLDAWTNNIDIPITALEPGKNFDFIITLTEEYSDQTKFYTKDQTADININKDASLLVKADDLKPVLTLTYEDAPVPATSTKYFSFNNAPAGTYKTVEATASNGSETETKSLGLTTQITLEEAGAIYLQVTDVPEGVTIEKITLK